MKQSRSRRRRFQRGVTYIEVLVASLIVAVSLAAISSLWYCSYNLSAKTDSQGAAYSVGRHVLEVVKQTGFANTAEGSSTRYYSKTGGEESTTQISSSVYSAVTSVSSDLTVSGSNPVQPENGAIRTVTITVKQIATNQTLYTTTTYLARAGI